MAKSVYVGDLPVFDSPQEGDLIAGYKKVDDDVEYSHVNFRKPGAATGTLPAGGSTGQVPTKKSAADYDVEWKDPSGGVKGTLIADWNNVAAAGPFEKGKLYYLYSTAAFLAAPVEACIGTFNGQNLTVTGLSSANRYIPGAAGQQWQSLTYTRTYGANGAPVNGWTRVVDESAFVQVFTVYGWWRIFDETLELSPVKQYFFTAGGKDMDQPGGDSFNAVGYWDESSELMNIIGVDGEGVYTRSYARDGYEASEWKKLGATVPIKNVSNKDIFAAASSQDANTVACYSGEHVTNAPSFGWFYYTVKTYASGGAWASIVAQSFGSDNEPNITYTAQHNGTTYTGWKRMEPIPAGGTTGQTLVKKSSNPYDVEWKTPSGGGGASFALTAKLRIRVRGSIIEARVDVPEEQVEAFTAKNPGIYLLRKRKNNKSYDGNNTHGLRHDVRTRCDYAFTDGFGDWTNPTPGDKHGKYNRQRGAGNATFLQEPTPAVKYLNKWRPLRQEMSGDYWTTGLLASVYIFCVRAGAAIEIREGGDWQPTDLYVISGVKKVGGSAEDLNRKLYWCGGFRLGYAPRPAPETDFYEKFTTLDEVHFKSKWERRREGVTDYSWHPKLKF